MKYLITLLLSLSLFAANAQTPVVAGTVQTVTAMKSYFGPVNKMYVVVTNSEYILCTACTADEVTVFAGTSGKKWKRIVQSSIPRDSIVGLNSLLATKIGASDTSTFRGTDRNYALTLANARVRYTDTAAYRAIDRAYAAGLVTGKLNISDTAIARAADRAYALALANAKLNIADTALARQNDRNYLVGLIQDTTKLGIGLIFNGDTLMIDGSDPDFIALIESLAPGGTSYTFTPSDFNESGSTISIDYVNGQTANGSTKGFLSAADWTNFNSKQAADSDLTTFAAISPANDDILQRKSGAWVNRTLAQVRTDLAINTNLAVTPNATTATITSSTGSSGTIPEATSSAAGLLNAAKHSVLFDKTVATWSTGTVTVDALDAQHDITISATGARTLAFSNIAAERKVVIYINNSSGADITLTLPAASFLQNVTTGVYASATTLNLVQGRTKLVLDNYRTSGTEHWFIY